MSTQFFAGSTGEWVATRWWGGMRRGKCMDFGANRSRCADSRSAAMAGETFTDEFGHEWTGAEFMAEMERCTVTFGEFGGSFQLGSGNAATFEDL